MVRIHVFFTVQNSSYFFPGAQEVPPVTFLETNVNDFFDQAIVIVQSLVGSKRIDVTLTIDSNMPKKLLLSGTLLQVLLNLGSNAVKFQKSGKIDFVVSLDDTKSEFEVLVIDQGSGISEEFRSQLFQPYQRSKDSAATVSGTGLGLCISKRLIAAMGGKLGYSPGADNIGSVFFVRLPTVPPTRNGIVVKEPSCDITVKDTSSDVVHLKRNVSIGHDIQVDKQCVTLIDVLIVEDGDVNRLVLLSMLKVETSSCILLRMFCYLHLTSRKWVLGTYLW
jgi:hypothetical protein